MALAIWGGVFEIVVPPESEYANKKGFMNVVAWAENSDHFKTKVETYLRTFEWQVIETENLREIDLERDYTDEFNDQLERVQQDETFIILGTFHTYKTN